MPHFLLLLKSKIISGRKHTYSYQLSLLMKRYSLLYYITQLFSFIDFTHNSLLLLISFLIILQLQIPSSILPWTSPELRAFKHRYLIFSARSLFQHFPLIMQVFFHFVFNLNILLNPITN